MGAILPAAACRRSTHPKQSCEGRATGFQPSDLFSHSFICSEASAGSHMGRDSYISVNGCSLSCEILRPKVSRARSESLRLSALRNIWKRLTPYGPITRIRKPPACFIPSIFFPWAQFSPFHCAEHTHAPLRTAAAVELSTRAGRTRADPNTSLETCCSQAQLRERQKRQ